MPPLREIRTSDAKSNLTEVTDTRFTIVFCRLDLNSRNLIYYNSRLFKKYIHIYCSVPLYKVFQKKGKNQMFRGFRVLRWISEKYCQISSSWNVKGFLCYVCLRETAGIPCDFPLFPENFYSQSGTLKCVFLYQSYRFILIAPCDMKFSILLSTIAGITFQIIFNSTQLYHLCRVKRNIPSISPSFLN